MKDHVWKLFVIYIITLLTFVIVALVTFLGQPPRHCHYLVPVKTKPGIYACSEYPRPMVQP